MKKMFLGTLLFALLGSFLFSACSSENGYEHEINSIGADETLPEDELTDSIIVSEIETIPEAENGILFFQRSGSSSSKSQRKSSSSAAPVIPDPDPESSSVIPGSSSSALLESSSSERIVQSSSSSSVAPSSSSSDVWDWSVPTEDYFNSDISYDSMVDERDGQKYYIVNIANRWWFAQNLNYNGEEVLGESWCYGDEDQHCEVTGRLYTWDAATVACPEGWRLPYPAEWSVLITYSGGSQNAGRNLKSTVGWFSGLYDKDGNGTDSLGFSALPAGWRTREGVYDELGKNAYFWKNSGDTYGSYVSMYYADRIDDSYHYKTMAFSVRCIEELAE